MNDRPRSVPGEPRVGEAVGPYRIVGELGGGGMGHVYKADGPDGVAVAVKLMKSDLANDATFRKRFDGEARIARDLEHPRVVRVIDSSEHHRVPYLVQEFVGGGSLETRLKQRGTLDIGTTVSVCTDVAAGLDALHEFARRRHITLVHRDVKPGNILLDDRGTAYITDFGLAKDSRGTVLTMQGQALGTPDYMAPEQIRAGRDVGPPTDVYALGCVMYECLTGVPPFKHLEGMRVLWGHLRDPPPDRLRDRADIPEELGSPILLALEKEPAKRPQSAGELAQKLQQTANAVVGPAPDG